MHSRDLVVKYLKNQGYSIKEVSLGTNPSTSYFYINQAGKHGKISSSKYISGYKSTKSAREIASDKTKSHDLAKYLNFPHPETIAVDANSFNEDDLRKFIKRHKNVIVKPHNGSRSRGLSIDISTIDSARQAIEKASKVDDTVLIQEQMYGEEARFIIIKNKVRSVLLREKPHVIGDGTSSVSDLIMAENISRYNIKHSLVPYPKLTNPMIDADIDLDYVPKRGERVELSKATMIKNGASVYDIIKKIHLKYIQEVERLANGLQTNMICIDVMLKNDYTKEPTDESYGLIEINTGMALSMCYSCRDGENFPIIEEFIGPEIIKSLS